MKKIFILCIIGLLLQACAWVELTHSGDKTRLLSKAEVSQCKKLGKTTVSLKAKIAGYERNQEKVQKELNILARNAASDLKGDTVVPFTKPKDGRQVFEVYRCINP